MYNIMVQVLRTIDALKGFLVKTPKLGFNKGCSIIQTSFTIICLHYYILNQYSQAREIDPDIELEIEIGLSQYSQAIQRMSKLSHSVV